MKIKKAQTEVCASYFLLEQCSGDFTSPSSRFFFVGAGFSPSHQKRNAPTNVEAQFLTREVYQTRNTAVKESQQKMKIFVTAEESTRWKNAKSRRAVNFPSFCGFHLGNVTPTRSSFAGIRSSTRPLPRGKSDSHVEATEASAVAMDRPIQAKTNSVSPPTHAPRLNVAEYQCATTTPAAIRIPARNRNMRIPYIVAKGK